MGLSVRVLVIERRATVVMSIARGLRNLNTVEYVVGKSTAEGVAEAVRNQAYDMVVLGRDEASEALVQEITDARPGALIVQMLARSSTMVARALCSPGDGMLEFVFEPESHRQVHEWCERQIQPVLERLVASWSSVTPRSKQSEALPAYPEAIVLGASTGGPAAIHRFLSALRPERCPPIIAVQHMSPGMMSIFCAHLRRTLDWPIFEVTADGPLAPKGVSVAGSDCHLTLVRRQGALWCVRSGSVPIRGCVPSVDVLFRSASEVLGAGCIGVVLTGIGRDGEEGARALHESGAVVLAQDQESSVVWGMPGSVARAGYATEVLPLDALGPYVQQRLLATGELATRR